MKILYIIGVVRFQIESLYTKNWVFEHFVDLSVYCADHHGSTKVDFWKQPTNPGNWKEEHFVLISLSGWGLLFYSGYKLATGGKKETPVESTQWVSLSPGRPFMERPLILMHFVFPFSRLWLVLCFILKIICITFEIWWCLQWINSWQFCVS